MVNNGLPLFTMVRILAIANQKGGVGKTTTAVNLAHGLARYNKRVLLIDLDHQGSAALALGIEPAPATYRLLLSREPLTKLIVPARDNLDFLASDNSLADVRDWIGMKSMRDSRGALGRLRDAVQGEIGRYDFVLIDCGPGLDMLTLNALMLAGEVLIPVSMDFLSAAGTRQHLQTLDEMQQAGGSAELRFVVPTRYDGRLNRAKKYLALLQQTFGDLVTQPIRNNTRLAEAPDYGRTIFEHDPKSLGAQDYDALGRSVLDG